MRYAVPILLALFLPGCATGPGPGASCDPCAEKEVGAGADAAAPFAQAAAASAKGGQEASNQPVQADPGARGILTPVSRGAGDQTVNSSTNEARSQAGAPSVNQGLVLPTAADARTGGGVSPVVASLQAYIDDLRAALKMAMLDPASPPDRANQIMVAINDAVGQMAQAQASAQATTHNTYNLQGSVVTQTVANGSASGDGQNAIDPANAKAVAEGLPEVVKAAAAAKSAAQPDSTFPAPSEPK